jgi:hypothetical protein
MKLAGTCSFIHQLLQRRHQRLDLVRLAHHRVPEQEAHRRADHQHHEGAQRAGAVVLLVVQVEQRRHPAEHDEHLVEVADRDVADVGRDLVALEPAHQRAHQRHDHAAQARREPDAPVLAAGPRPWRSKPIQ